MSEDDDNLAVLIGLAIAVVLVIVVVVLAVYGTTAFFADCGKTAETDTACVGGDSDG